MRKYRQLTELIRDGFEVVEITSDTRSITTRLARTDGREATVRFDRSDAERLLFDVDGGEGSQFLVTGPLR